MLLLLRPNLTRPSRRSPPWEDSSDTVSSRTTLSSSKVRLPSLSPFLDLLLERLLTILLLLRCLCWNQEESRYSPKVSSQAHFAKSSGEDQPQVHRYFVSPFFALVLSPPLSSPLSARRHASLARISHLFSLFLLFFLSELFSDVSTRLQLQVWSRKDAERLSHS